MKRVLCVGECMVELTEIDARTLGLGFGGDTYNTAVYLYRVAVELDLELEVGYLTGLGDDEYSKTMREAWAAEGIVDRALIVADRKPGMYAIRTSTNGERHFSYWRDRSAASVLMAEPGWVDHVAGDVVHLSGVTLQLGSPASRRRLEQRLSALRDEGSCISFDLNFRPAGWPSAADAAAVMDRFCAVSSVVLSSADDERLLHGACDPHKAVRRIADLGPAEVVLRDGPNGAYVLADGEIEHAPGISVDAVVDTTAAGDAFTGGYLAARLNGQAPSEAARLANRVASACIQRKGAIAPQGVSLVGSTSRVK
jgi:2-dehydro-3-deoxygluconokinase